MVSCNGDIDEDIDEGMVLAVNGQEPVFTYKDFDAIPQDYEEITNGTWKIKKVNGLVREVSFSTQGIDKAASPAPPKTEEDFFKMFMPVTADNQMVFYDRDYRDDPHYLQYYKGVPVEQGFWHFYFHEDGTMHGGDGRFIPIGQLDVNPSVNMATARKIVENRRFDVIDALKPHLIGSQTLYHTYHPNVAEMTDLADYGEAYRLAAVQ